MSIQALTLDEIESNDSIRSVWILNSAADSKIGFEGELLINVPNAQGRPELLRVPQTWLPFNATGRFTKKRLLESTDFRNAVVEELITLIDEPTAQKINRETGAAEEMARLRAKDKQIREAGSVRKISDANVDVVNPNELRGARSNVTDVEVIGQQEEVKRTTAEVKAGSVTTKEGLSPNFMAFFDRLVLQGDEASLGLVKGKSKLSRRELRYLRDNLPKHPKTVKNIKSRLIELKKAVATS
jgi:hypothetical protein